MFSWVIVSITHDRFCPRLGFYGLMIQLPRKTHPKTHINPGCSTISVWSRYNSRRSGLTHGSFSDAQHNQRFWISFKLIPWENSLNWYNDAWVFPGFSVVFPVIQRIPAIITLDYFHLYRKQLSRIVMSQRNCSSIWLLLFTSWGKGICSLCSIFH
jgi:hypothetical protein